MPGLSPALLIIILVATGCSGREGHGSDDPRVQAGRIDAGSHDFSEKSLTLAGDWQFIPDRFLHHPPADPAGPLVVPGPWNTFPKKAGSMGPHGTGTYVLQIDGLTGRQGIGLLVSYVTSAHRLYFYQPGRNATALLIDGQPGTGPATSVPGATRRLVRLPVSDPGPAFLILHVSNFHWPHGGIFRAPVLGDYEALLSQGRRMQIVTLVLMGMTLALALHSMSIFMRWRQDKSALVLAALAVAATFVLLSLSLETFYWLFAPSTLSYAFLRYCWGSITILIMALIHQFHRTSFPRHFHPGLNRFIWYVAIPGHILYLVMPFSAPIAVTRFFQLAGLLFPLVFLPQLFGAWRDQVRGAGFSFFGAGVLVAATINDSISHFRLGETIPFLQVGIFVFIFCQSQVLGIRYANLIRDRQRTHNRLSQARDQLRREQTISLTARMLAHDIRKPFQILSLNLAALGKAGDADEFQRIAGRFRSDLEETRLSVETMLDELMKVDKPMEATTGPASLNKLLSECLQALPDLYGPCRIRVDTRHAGQVRMAPAMLRRLLTNLINNAREAMVDADALIISSAGDSERLDLRIRNTGCWLPAAVRHRLFEPFYTMGKEGGSGLGLSSVRRIVDAHGGTITCRSRQNPPWTEFRIWLPMTTDRDEPFDPACLVTSPAPSRPSGPANDTDEPLVLVLDDQLIFLDHWQAKLKGTGVRVRCFPSPGELLEFLRRDPGCIPAVEFFITDFHLGSGRTIRNTGILALLNNHGFRGKLVLFSEEIPERMEEFHLHPGKRILSLEELRRLADQKDQAGTAGGHQS